MKKSVIVGMSGGVDSAVAAYLLKENGYDVIGVFMKNWKDDDSGLCNARIDYEDVCSVCETIGIPYYHVSFENEYWDRVFTYFLNEYKSGRTPNPDVLCNSEIKFSAFLNFALKSGADFIATGHYACIDYEDNHPILKKGMDQDKDQSYFLCGLNQKQLAKTLFPLGKMLKTNIRVIAKEIGLSVAHKKDSTGICFIGERKFKNFLQSYIPANSGDIMTCDGKCIGKHDGLMYYTLGQRRGLAIGGIRGSSGERWYVIKKDLVNNILYVNQGKDNPDLFSSSLIMSNVNFISGKPKDDDFFCNVKVRYRQPDQQAHITCLDDKTCRVDFKYKQRAVTPGQYCVLYDGDICLGGGIIENKIE